MRESSSMCGRNCLAPRAQLKPTESGFAWRTEFQNDSAVCPASVRPAEAVSGSAGRVRVDGFGLRDVGARLEVLRVDLADHLRARDGEEVVVAAQVLAEILEALAAELRFREVVALDHRAHGAVEHEDALLEGILERGKSGRACGYRLVPVSPPPKPRRHCLK